MGITDVPLTVRIDFGSQGTEPTSEEVKLLFENITKYRRLNGWTHKRMYLMGAANMIGKDNPDLVLQIAEYMSGIMPQATVDRRKGKRNGPTNQN